MNNKICFRAGIVLIIICLVFLSMFNIFCNNNRLNADSSSEMVLGKILSEETAVVSPRWCYSTEVRLLNYQLVTTPLFMITDNWHAIRAISNTVFYILLLLSYFFLMTGVGVRWGYILLSSVLLITPLSVESIDIIHIGGFYIPHIIVLFLTLGLYLRKDKKWAFILLVLLSIISGISGIRYLLTIQHPLFMAEIFVHYKNDLKKVIPSAVVFVSYGAGFVINHFLHRFFVFFDETSVSFYENTNPVLRLGDITDGILELFGLRHGAPVKSLPGLISMAAFLMLAIAVFLVCGKIKSFNAGDKDFLFTFFTASFLVNTFVFLVGSDEVYDARYYFPVLIMLVPLAAKALSGKKNRSIPVTAVIVCAVIMGGATLFEAASFDRNEHRYESIEFLTENGYDFGYSTFWNANITTELSNGKVRMANFSEDFDDIKPYMWLTPKKYYDGSVKAEKPFILLTCDEYEKAEGKFGNNPVYRDNSFVILDGKPEF